MYAQPINLFPNENTKLTGHGKLIHIETQGLIGGIYEVRH
jgi:hypothetical protein